MKNSTYKFDFKDLKLNVSQIERVIGYKEGEKEEVFSDLIKDVLKEVEAICSIKAEYAIFSDVKFIDSDKSVEIDKIVFQIKKVVYSQLKKSDSIAVFICTAGEEIGSRSRKQ